MSEQIALIVLKKLGGWLPVTLAAIATVFSLITVIALILR
jgi:hypothetical protein